MKKTIITGVVGFILGLLVMGGIMYQMAPGLMILESESKYNFDETVAKFEQSVKDHNWKIPKVHNLQATMAKFGKEVRPVKVVELCHPDHAGKILKQSDERVVSSLMPCRVAFYEKDDGKVYISRMNSSLMAQMMSGVIPEVMDEASKDTEEILKAVLSN